MSPSPLIEAMGLGRSYQVGGLFEKHYRIAAVSGVDLAIARGETMALVGESGCGKSTLGRLLLGIEPANTGHVVFDGQDLATATDRERRHLKARMQLVFQNTLAALDPRMTVGRQILEPFAIHGDHIARKEISPDRLMSDVGLGRDLAERYPHQLSGGQRQRVVIARALATTPDFVVFDEPVSALDVSVQAQIIALIKTLCRDRGTSVMLVTHDMGVIAETADRVAVMYAGRIAEIGPVRDVVKEPLHPYAKGLMGAIPSLEGETTRLVQIPGSMPRLSAIPPGCAFNPRCGQAFARCHVERPELVAVGDRMVACHLYDEPRRSGAGAEIAA